MKQKTHALFLLIAWCCGAQAGVREPFEELAEDWGGIRSFLGEKGVDFASVTFPRRRRMCKGVLKSSGGMQTSGLSPQHWICKRFWELIKHSSK